MSMCPTWEDNSIFILNPVFMCFSTKSNDWLARNQDNVSKWRDMHIRGLLFQ